MTTLPSTTLIAAVFLRLFVVFAITAWSTYTLRKLWAVIADLRANWNSWETYPVPDMRACRNLAIAFAIFAGWSLLTAGLTFALTWVLGI